MYQHPLFLSALVLETFTPCLYLENIDLTDNTSMFSYRVLFLKLSALQLSCADFVQDLAADVGMVTGKAPGTVLVGLAVDLLIRIQ